jgi:hypothetical protein
MYIAKDEEAALLANQIKEITSDLVTPDNNPVARYAFFCMVYNKYGNNVDGKAYEVPNLASYYYKCFRPLWRFW